MNDCSVHSLVPELPLGGVGNPGDGHAHRLAPVVSGSEIYGNVRYRLFLGPIGALVWRLLVRGWVEGIFDYRAGEVPALLTRAPAAPPRRTA